MSAGFIETESGTLLNMARIEALTPKQRNAQGEPTRYVARTYDGQAHVVACRAQAVIGQLVPNHNPNIAKLTVFLWSEAEGQPEEVSIEETPVIAWTVTEMDVIPITADRNPLNCRDLDYADECSARFAVLIDRATGRCWDDEGAQWEGREQCIEVLTIEARARIEKARKQGAQPTVKEAKPCA